MKKEMSKPLRKVKPTKNLKLKDDDYADRKIAEHKESFKHIDRNKKEEKDAYNYYLTMNERGKPYSVEEAFNSIKKSGKKISKDVEFDELQKFQTVLRYFPSQGYPYSTMGNTLKADDYDNIKYWAVPKGINLSKKQIEMLKKEFKDIDYLKEHKISGKYVMDIMESLKCYLNKKEVNDIFKEMNLSKEDLISFQDLCSFANRAINGSLRETISTYKSSVLTTEASITTQKEEEKEEPIIKAFMFFDEDKDGKIPTKTFRNILQNMCYKFNKNFVDKLFKEAGLNDKRYCDYRKFVSYWKKANPDKGNIISRLEYAKKGH